MNQAAGANIENSPADVDRTPAAGDGPVQLEAAPDVRRARTRIVRFLERYALLVLLLAVALFFCFWSETADTFPTVANLRILLASQTVVGVIALGLLWPLLCHQFDLSVGSVTSLSAVLVAISVSDSGSIVGSFGLALLVGAGVGGANGVIVTRLHVNGVIATLGMSTILTGVVLRQTGGLAPASNVPSSMTNFGTGTVVGIPIPFLALLAIAGVTYFVLNHTSLGRQIYAVGSNSEAATLIGLRTDRLRAATFVVSGVLSAVAGWLYVARAGGASPRVGDSLLLPAFAAAFLSAAVVRPGRFNVWGTIIAVYFLAVVNNGLSLAGVEPYVNDWVNGFALISGVAMASMLQRRATR